MGSTVQTSAFDNAAFIPPDAIFDLTRRYLADPDQNKVNLGQGTYRDENGKPWVLPSVRLAEDKIGDCGHEYLPIAGLKEFREEAVKLCLGGTQAFKEGRVSITVWGHHINANRHSDRVVPITIWDRRTFAGRARPEKGRCRNKYDLYHEPYVVEPRSPLQINGVRGKASSVLQSGRFRF